MCKSNSKYRVEDPEISIEKLVEILGLLVDMILKVPNTLGSPDRRAPDIGLTTKLVGKVAITDLEEV